MTLRVVVGSDHRGTAAKQRVIEQIRTLGHQVEDRGTADPQSVDYPDFAYDVAKLVASGRADRGILFCCTGLGMCMAANKVHGIRAATCHDEITAAASRQHNDANVLCLAADLLGQQIVDRLVEIWLATEFEGGRHTRRIQKIREIEDREAAEFQGRPRESRSASNAPPPNV